MKHVYLSFVPIFCVAALLFIIPVTILFAAPSNGNPPIEWEQSELTVSLFTDTADLVAVRFYTKESVENFATRVTPPLEAFIRDQAIIQVAEDEYILFLTLTAPAESKGTTQKGVLRIVDGKRTVPQVLKVTVAVVEASATIVPAGLSTPAPDVFAIDDAIEYVKGELLVGLEFGTRDPQRIIADIATRFGGVFVGSDQASQLYQLRFTAPDLQSLYDLAEEIKQYSEVSLAVPNYGIEDPFLHTYPNDPKYLGNYIDLDEAIAEEWDENNPGGINWYHEVMRLPSAWSIETGDREVRVGIVDSKIKGSEPDIKPNFDGHEMADLQYWLSGFADEPHGTQVAGSVCARGNNSIGITGTSWQCGLTSYSAWSAMSIGSLNVGGAYDAMTDAIEDNMQIVNISLRAIGKSGVPKVPTDAEKKKAADINALLSQAVVSAKQQNKDILWVIAAGNSTMDATHEAPAGLSLLHDNVITVAATERDGTLASFSNYGEAVSVAAPGVEIATVNYKAGSGYAFGEGTSFSSPLVAGIAVLLKSHAPHLTARQLKSAIISGSEVSNVNVPGHQFAVANAKSSLCLVSQSHNICQGPEIQNITIENVTKNNALVLWSTDEPATSIVQYGRSATLPNNLITSDSFVTSHSVPVPNLLPDTTYYIRVAATDIHGNKSESQVMSFRTLPDRPAFNRPPVLSFPTSGQFANDGISPNSGDPDTFFSFSVLYSDPDNDWPRYVNLKIDGVRDDGAIVRSTNGCTGPDTLSYVTPQPFFNTEYCNLKKKLNSGTYTYWYEAYDGQHLTTSPVSSLRVDPAPTILSTSTRSL